MGTIHTIEELDIWVEAKRLCVAIRKFKGDFSQTHDYELWNQIQRSSGSVMDNIAEGHERGGTKEFIHFLSIAKASAGETRSQLHRAIAFQIIPESSKVLVEEYAVLSKRIGALMVKLRESNYRETKFKT